MNRPLLLLLCLLAPAHGATSPHFGGQLHVAVTSPHAAFWETGMVCRLHHDAIRPGVAQSVTQLSDTRIRIELRKGLRHAQLLPFTTREFVAEWQQMLAQPRFAAARDLLQPVTNAGKLNIVFQDTYILELELSFPFPEYAKALCHPALGIFGQGPFRRKSDKVFEANLFYGEGRPYVDELHVSPQQRAQVTEGPSEKHKSPALWATWLGFRPEMVSPSFRAAFEKAVSRNDLLRGQSMPMTTLLPPALSKSIELTPFGATSEQALSTSEWVLLYDEALPQNKWVAQRLQVKLFELGLRVSPKGVPLRQLQARWEIGDFDLVLHTLLLSPVVSVAEWQVRRLAKENLASLIPLYAQSMSFQTASNVGGFALDAHGLPLWDDLFFTEPNSRAP